MSSSTAAPSAPPGVAVGDSSDAWAATGASEAVATKPVKKGGDGKAGVFMASFNLSNAVRLAACARACAPAGSPRAAPPPSPPSTSALPAHAHRPSLAPPRRCSNSPPALPPPPTRPQILGAGVGGMPYALKEAGFYSGLILMMLVAASSDFSVRMLIKLAQRVKKHHYEQLVQSQFGKAGYIAVSAAMGIFAYGAMCAYLIGIGACARAPPSPCVPPSWRGRRPPPPALRPATTPPAAPPPSRALCARRHRARRRHRLDRF